MAFPEQGRPKWEHFPSHRSASTYFEHPGLGLLETCSDPDPRKELSLVISEKAIGVRRQR